MNLFLKQLKFILPAASLFFATLSYTEPTFASVSCKSMTANNHSNGSLASCILDRNMMVSISSNHIYCQEGQAIYFDEQGQFNHCTISENLVIRQGNTVRNCQAGSQVYVNVDTNNMVSVSCY